MYIKKFLFLLVNFESYSQLMDYLLSIQQAASLAKDTEVEILVADNTESHIQEIERPVYSAITVRIYPYHQNCGYLGGINRLIQEIDDLQIYHYVVISNVDILLPDTFFQNISDLHLSSNIAWIAPSIYSEKEGLDRNPELVCRPSALKLRSLMVMYKYNMLIRLYNRFFYQLRRKKKIAYAKQETYIYAGHGSFMVFTRAFFLCEQSLNYACFLFGEEIFLAELIRKHNLKVLYVPSIQIRDIDHIATSKIDRKKYYQLKYKSVEYLYKTFFRPFSISRP